MNTSWSFSNFSTALSCLQKYKLQVIDKIVVPGLESGDMAFGTAVHLGVHAAITGGNGEEVFQIYWETQKTKDLSYTRFDWYNLSEIGATFLRKFKERHASRYVVTEAEQRLKAPFYGVMLEGTPDFIGMYDGKRALLDFKTAGYNYHKQKALVSLQLHLYAYLAMEACKFTPEVLGFIVFNKGTGSIQIQTIPFDLERMNNMLYEMSGYINKINSTTIYPKNYNACIIGNNTCPYFNLCHTAQEDKK